MIRLALALVLLAAVPLIARGAGARHEISHDSQGHEANVSSPAVAVVRGAPVVAWIAQGDPENVLLVARPGEGGSTPVRVNPPGSSVLALHQAPGMAVGPDGELYLTWATPKKPEGELFASDIMLSQSLDGGQRFDAPLRVNADRPISHTFEDLAIAPDGSVLVAWIDAREGADRPRTYVARVGDRGRRLEGEVRVDDEETCVCCRVALAAGPRDSVAVLWRKVLAGDVRDMALATSRDGGRSFGRATLVHADRWKIAACPHRGGSLASDGRGGFYAAWYTEGRDEQPRLLWSRTGAGASTPPARLDAGRGWVPDQVRLAAVRDRVAAVWEETTAARRRVIVRLSSDGGRTFGPRRNLSAAVKAFAPAVATGGENGFVVAWHEERWPKIVTVVDTIK